jgi:DNA-binding IclR family transcriptional regulator
MRPQSTTTAKEFRSLLATLTVIRILKHAADAPTTAANLCQRLPTKDTSSLNRTLVRLRRNGWLTEKTSEWSLTPEGRKALNLAVRGLEDLVGLFDR